MGWMIIGEDVAGSVSDDRYDVGYLSPMLRSIRKIPPSLPRKWRHTVGLGDDRGKRM